MVISGMLRRSVRPRELVTGLARSASSIASRGNSVGMPCAWIAIRLTALGSFIEPKRSTMRARGAPYARPATGSATHELAFARAAEIAVLDHQGVTALAVDRLDAGAPVVAREHAEHAMRARAQPLDDPSLIRRVCRPCVRVMRASTRSPRPSGREASSSPGTIRTEGGGSVPLPLDRAPEEVAVRVLAEDFEHRHFGQRAGRDIGLLPALLDDAFVLELAQDLLQRLTFLTLQLEDRREVALGVARMRGEIFEDRILGDGFTLLRLRVFAHGICRKTVSNSRITCKRRFGLRSRLVLLPLRGPECKHPRIP